MLIAALLRELKPDRSIPTALHYQIGRSVERMIANGRLRPGDQLPSVQELASLCGVSLGTAMRAVTDLKEAGVVTTKRGCGTRVAELNAPTTEILLGEGDAEEGTSLWSFYQQLVEGLQEGYKNRERRYVTTSVAGAGLSAREILAVARARNVDSMVAYRPRGEVLHVLAEVAEKVPCVSLFYEIPDSSAPCVVPDTKDALRRMLLRRIEAGCRDFAYVGHAHFLRRSTPPLDQVTASYNTFHEVMQASGIQPHRRLTEDTAGDADQLLAAELRLASKAEDLPDGCVVFAQFASLAQRLTSPARGFDVISYTECRASLGVCLGRMSVLYVGLEMLARAAVPLLRNPPPVDETGRPCLIRVRPRVFLRDLEKPERKEDLENTSGDGGGS